MKKNRQKIGVLGGTFDPVHLGHLGLARETFEAFDLDRVLLVPVFQSPHKKRIPTASPLHRLEMLRLALKNDSKLEIMDVEVRRKELSYTIDTLDYIESRFPDSELFLILGRDNLPQLDSWKDAGKIMERFHILVASRPGQEQWSAKDAVLGLFGGASPYTVGGVEKDILEFRHGATGRRLVVFQIAPHDISSSVIREKIAGGESVKNLLLPEVEIYIMNNQIYQAPSQL
ncbi:hypothetical protein UR09_00435 [Candidatus Nitromaritima sp. SCGC AAA799-A02]|nr:hypothetical protein UR09_00435 [Candidatus Nitromaritima sp. SCGC AAA799-A02]